MATTTKTGKKRGLYLKLIQKFPLRPIRSDEELDRAIRVIDSLLDRAHLEPDEKDYLDVLSDQVERYEDAHVVIPPATDAEMLQHLIEAKGVTKAEVAKGTGLAESAIREVLSGKRTLTRQHIGKLARFFCVAPRAFCFGE